MSELGHPLPNGRNIFVTVAYLAGHVAAGNGGALLDVEITHQPSGKPELALTGRGQEGARGPGVTPMAVSISHSVRYVVTQVILEADD
jgi:phosphopantetheinyl transferase (holo-ACP synthase)